MKIINFTLSDPLIKNLNDIKNREGITNTSEMLRFLIKYFYYNPFKVNKYTDNLIDKTIQSIETKISKENPDNFESLEKIMANV